MIAASRSIVEMMCDMSDIDEPKCQIGREVRPMRERHNLLDRMSSKSFHKTAKRYHPYYSNGNDVILSRRVTSGHGAWKYSIRIKDAKKLRLDPRLNHICSCDLNMVIKYCSRHENLVHLESDYMGDIDREELVNWLVALYGFICQNPACGALCKPVDDNSVTYSDSSIRFNSSFLYGFCESCYPKIERLMQRDSLESEDAINIFLVSEIKRVSGKVPKRLAA